MANRFTSRLVALALAAGGPLGVTGAPAAAQNDTLRAAFQIEIANLDTYYDSAGSVVVMSRHIWDALFYIDPADSELKPLLAESHRFVDERTLVIALRRGVRFHDGNEMTARDVAYTLNWIRDPANKVRTITSPRWMSAVEVIDDYTVRIRMDEPTALALRFLSVFPIYRAGTYDKDGVGAMNINPIGTGPYRVVSVDPGREFALKRFSDYFADSPKGQASIENLVVRIIPEPGTQIAEIIAGGLNWIYSIGADQVQELGRIRTLTVDSRPTSRMMYMVMDAAGRTGAESPFKDIRVRKALSHAIDRPTLVAALVGGGAQVLNAFCFPEDFGCPADAVTFGYDPARARALLAEAGFPKGFRVTLSAWRDRSYVEALMGMLAEVGIQTDLNYINLTPLRDQWNAGQLPLIYGSIGSQISDIGNFVPEFFGLTARDLARDEQVAAWLREAGSETNEDRRRDLSHKALRRVAEQAYALPLFSDNMNFAMTRGLSVPSDSGGAPHFYRARWN